MLEDAGGYVVSKAQMEDLPAVKALAEASVGGPHWPESAWASFVSEAVSRGHHAVLLLIRNRQQRLCGWLAGTVLGEVAELEFLFVAPEKRHSGLGRSLLRAWTERAASQGATVMLLEVRASNRAALRLYRHWGFSAEGSRKSYYSNPVEDAVTMRLTL